MLVTRNTRNRSRFARNPFSSVSTPILQVNTSKYVVKKVSKFLAGFAMFMLHFNERVFSEFRIIL